MEITKREDLMRQMALERFAEHGWFRFQDVSFMLTDDRIVTATAFTPWSREQIPPGIARQELERARLAHQQLLATDREAARIIASRAPRFELYNNIYGERDDGHFICRLEQDQIVW